ncbi:TIGR02206 family membrane protein [Lysinibacillus contaminans]|uniref:YwaF family protein n=1 Tax=Lysinibacillus contaminans TaxID=1293441 RepID=UPI0006AEB0B9|nr:TIGR02206 family membrane protein [Lysinibacillus contaminans]
MLKDAIQSLENGFQLFDWYHVSWLVLTALVIFIMFKIYRQADLKKRRKIRIIWALVILMLEGIKNLVLVGQDAFWYGSLPFHLCGLGIFIVLVHAFRKGHSVDMLLYCLTLPGAFMSLLTPDWTDVSAFNYLHFHSFLFHLLLFAYPVTMLAAQELQLSIRKIWQPILFLCIIVPLIYVLNVVWGTNFMFLNEPPAGTPLVLLEDIVGEKYYIIGFIGLVIVYWILLLLPIVFLKKRQ